MKLLIVESPSKAKTIEKYLGGEFTVRASVGHVRDLPKSNKTAIDIPAGFVPRYEISKGKEKVIDELTSLAKKATAIMLATDPDREGEAISFHLKEILDAEKKVKAPIKRVAFNEITKEAVEKALLHPRDIDDKLVKAQEARRVLDRLVGYDLSGLIWKKVRYGLSAGRVQSPALRLIMEREREIRAFIPEKYWVLEADVETSKTRSTGSTSSPQASSGQAEKMRLVCAEEPRDEKEADKILETGKANDWHVTDVKESQVKRSPRAPFTTSTLQQTASSRLGFSPKRTMMVAQKLYELGHITYMRTDSTTLGADAVKNIAKLVENEYGKNYLEIRTYKTKVKNAQEAHEAIRPTHVEKMSAGANEEQHALYKLIWERTVSSQMTDAQIARTKISANIEPRNNVKSKSNILDEIPDFSITGSRVIFDGWLRADVGARGEDVELPQVKNGDPLILINLEKIGKETQPPARYSEAALVKALEERGIGRPSTYASIISTLQDRGYVDNESKSLKPTDTGDVVSSFLEENFPVYISDTFTADMESKLDDIANGDAEYVKTLKDFYTPFAKEVKEKDKLEKQTTLGDADENLVCPKCGSKMIIKLGRGGKFISCSRYPDCDGALTIEGLEIKGDVPIGTDPETGENIYVKTGRFGPYVQLGEQVKGSKKKPRMSSIPKEKNPTEVTLEDALVYLSLPRTLGVHPDTGKEIKANVGRFGPYVVHDGDFRSIKKTSGLDVYTITLEEALAIIAEPKKPRGFARKKK